ncbi:hypothetical protein [Arenibaculum pallidiluteum]|uniref:hypothetical protein n=1 Tax=Arenibaculum pallidiluteum TaxID=2812559 RepID=UPI001A957A77|nr:hypothetical protein [Arenibaculum pallidiluteum]
MRTVLAVLLPCLLLAALAGWMLWDWVPGGPDAGGRQVSGHGYVALALGALGSLVVGGGLMFLVFFSARRGYDDAPGEWPPRPADRDED